MSGIIYTIKNTQNGNFYVGSTINFTKRFASHKHQLRNRKHPCAHLQAAWNLYGEDAFDFVVEEVVEEIDALLAAEQRWLDAHFGKDHCYNAAACAGAPMRNAPQALRDKVSASRKGKAAGAEHYHYGRPRDAEVRAQIGATQRGVPKPGRKVTEEGRAKIRANIEAGRSHMHWLGRKHTEESRKLMSRAVTATDPEGNTHSYDSITALREALNLKPPTVHRSLQSGLPLKKGPKKGWSFAFS